VKRVTTEILANSKNREELRRRLYFSNQELKDPMTRPTLANKRLIGLKQVKSPDVLNNTDASTGQPQKK
jgi:hypothetical protein